MHFDDRSDKAKSGISYQLRANQYSPSRIGMHDSTRSNFYEQAKSPLDNFRDNRNSRLSACNKRIDASTEMIRFQKSRERKQIYGRSASWQGSSRKRKHKIFDNAYEDSSNTNRASRNYQLADRIRQPQNDGRQHNPMIEKMMRKRSRSREKSEKISLREINKMYRPAAGYHPPVHITYSNYAQQGAQYGDFRKPVPVRQITALRYPQQMKQHVVVNEIQHPAPQQFNPPIRLESVPCNQVMHGPSGHTDGYQSSNHPSYAHPGPITRLSPFALKPEMITKPQKRLIEIKQLPSNQVSLFDKNGCSQNFRTSTSSRNEQTLLSFPNTKSTVRNESNMSSTSPPNFKQLASNRITNSSRKVQHSPEEDQSDRFFDMDVNNLNQLRNSMKRKSYLDANIQTSSLHSQILIGNKNAKSNDFEGIKSPLQNKQTLPNFADKTKPSAKSMIQHAYNTLINADTEGKMITMILIGIGALLVLFQLLK